jgi:hypothetical protein
MKHQVSSHDSEFQREFEACGTQPDAFDHAAHVRLAYIYLCERPVDGAAQKMKQSLLAYLAHLKVDPAKYHETITRAWIMAVDYFMGKTQACRSADDFIAANPELLDSKIMLTHYSAAVLFSPEARRSFTEPDIQSIPPPKAVA